MTYKEVDGIDENGKACKFKVEIPTKKYIRTKDNIIPVSNVKVENGIKYATSILSGIEYSSKNENEKDVADTIKELCDEFVVAYESGARIVYGDLEWAKIKAKASLEHGNKSIIYGAIWTDKGLIYVAKMNEEGELELL